MNTTKTVLAFLFALATVALVGGCRHPQPGDAAPRHAPARSVVSEARHAPPVQEAAVEVVSAPALAADYANDRVASAGRFAKHTVKVTGVLGSLEAGADGGPVLTLKSGARFPDPRFVLEDDAWPDVSTLKAGASIAVSCRDVTDADGQVTAKACGLL